MGRPTEYKPEYCQMLIEHMASGKSFESFAAKLDTHRAVLYQWEHAQQDFADAKKIGSEKMLQFYEDAGIEGMYAARFHDAVWIFMMKNRFKWTDKIELSGSDSAPIKLIYDPDKPVPEPE